MTTTTAISWYGKLPSAGDFLQRRFPDALQRQWSHWFQLGLVNWQKEQERATDRQFGNAPVWNFVVPPMLGGQQVQMGCLLPGRDSVGRQYPLCALLAINPLEWSPRQLARSGDWYQQLGRTLLHAVRNAFSAEQLDQALHAIPLPQPVEQESRYRLRRRRRTDAGLATGGGVFRPPAADQLLVDQPQRRLPALYPCAQRQLYRPALHIVIRPGGGRTSRPPRSLSSDV